MNPHRPRPLSRSWLAWPIALAALAILPATLCAASQQADAADPGIQRPQRTLHEFQVRSLISRLTDPAWSVRQEAQDELIALGPDVLPIIAQSRDAVADLQAHATLELIEAHIVANLARTGRPIFVRFDDADASAALRELARQAGIALTIDERRLSGVRITGEIDGLCFWPAILQLSANHDIDVRPTDRGYRATRATEGAMRTIGGPASAYGPMIVLARGARYQRTLTLDRDPSGATLAEAPAASSRGQRFAYEFEALLEPRFAIGTRRFTVILTRAIDDAGNTLHAAGAADGGDLRRELVDPGGAGAGEGLAIAASVSEANWSSGRLTFDLDLLFPERPGTRLSLAGRIRGLVGADIVEMKVPANELADGATWHVAGERTKVRLEPTAAAGRWAFTLVSARAVTPEVADLLAVAVATAQLTDAASDRFRRGTLNSSTGDDGRLTLRLDFIGPTDETMLPRHLSCEVPRRAVELDVPFEFEDLPIP